MIIYERILETADLARMGEEAKEELANRLGDPDSAVRFWAVTGLCSLGVKRTMIVRLSPLLDDPSISVSLAAGDYLVRAGEGALALPAFERALASDILWTRLRAGAYLSYRSREELQPYEAAYSRPGARHKQTGDVWARTQCAARKEQLQRRAWWAAGWHRQGVGIGASDEKNRIVLWVGIGNTANDNNEKKVGILNDKFEG